jgi:sugar phosphate isomerase/epimerase
MKTSIATVSLSGTLGEKLEAIAAAKFDAVEIFENDLVTFNGTAISRACPRANASAPSREQSASSTSCRSSAPTC